MHRPHHKARLLRSVLLSKPAQTYHLEFDVPELERLDFVAGQFLSLVAPHQGKLQTRAYSIASAPAGDNRFDLCLNRVPDGFFSNLLCDMRPGDTVEFHGPHGYFTLRQPLRDSLLIATGTGVAPMRGFVEWLFGPEHGRGEALDRSDGRQIFLVYGTRYDTDLYYGSYFERVAREHPNFHCIQTLSRPGAAWSGPTGYVQDHVRAILEARPPEQRAAMDAYICGLNEMVSGTRQLLKEEFGWDRKQIVFERYD